jgi:hypothetical protein
VETTVEFDLPADEIRRMLEPSWSGPLGALGKRMLGNQIQRMTENLAGPTKITVFEAGIRVVAKGSEREIGWSAMRLVVERAGAWVFQLAPSGIWFIPAEAVPAAQRADFSARLRASAGSKYKVREGGIRQS